MNEQERITVLALCDAADRMRDATNDLWAAQNPADAEEHGIVPMSEDEAQERHSEAFRALEQMTFQARRAVEWSRLAARPVEAAPMTRADLARVLEEARKVEASLPRWQRELLDQAQAAERHEVASFPALPIDAEDERVVDALVEREHLRRMTMAVARKNAEVVATWPEHLQRPEVLEVEYAPPEVKRDG